MEGARLVGWLSFRLMPLRPRRRDRHLGYLERRESKADFILHLYACERDD